MQQSLAKPRRARYLLPAVLIIGVGLMFVFCCSGLHLPVWRSRTRLNNHLFDDLALILPASASVTHAVSEAYRDPGEYYRVEMPAVDAVAFMAKVRSASNHPKYDNIEDVDPNQPWSMGRSPNWWKPQSLPNVKRFDRLHMDSQGGYKWFFSDSVGVLYVFWFRT